MTTPTLLSITFLVVIASHFGTYVKSVPVDGKDGTLSFDFSMTDAEGQNTNFSMSSDAEKSNAKRHFKYMEEEDGEETGLDIILTHKVTGESSGDWSDWSTCSATCGNATRTRSKMCSLKNETETQSEPCPNLPPCDTCVCNVEGSLTEQCDKDGKCSCKANIIGEKCNACKDEFHSFPLCEACQCDPDGSMDSSCDANGICSCKENFKGDQCKECKPGFFQHPNCLDCKCSEDGAVDSSCDDTGMCTCKSQISGDKCDKCLPGHYNFPTCPKCECSGDGSNDQDCDDTGKCSCKDNVGGMKCDACNENTFGYPDCKDCNCNTDGSTSLQCKDDGTCVCKTNIDGQKCDQCMESYYNFPACSSCNCNVEGSESLQCDKNGQCKCKTGFTGLTCSECNVGFEGDQCDKCAPEFYGYPDCKACECNDEGSKDKTCDKDGKCNCSDHVNGDKCSTCSEGYYKFPECLDCQCSTEGSTELQCDVNGKCSCNDFVEGDKCTICSETSFDYPNCKDCKCNPNGSTSMSCDNKGDCTCKSGFTGSKCDECMDGLGGDNCNECALGSFSYPDCQDCGCDENGSDGKGCNEDGVCTCKSNVDGEKCDKCKPNFFQFPSCKAPETNGLKVLIVTRYPDKTMLLDLKNPDFECKEPPKFPFKYFTGQGAFIDGSPMYCGGLGGDPYISKQCYMLQSRNWIKTGVEMDIAAYSVGRGNVVINNKLLISGGDGEYSIGRKTSNELISTTGKIDLPDLPQKLRGHCNVLLNNTHLLTTGGQNKGRNCDSQKTFILNLETKIWTDGPEMLENRCNHGCPKVKVGDDQEFVLIYGGDQDPNGAVSSEYLNVLDIGSGWKKGPDLAKKLSRNAEITSPDMKEIYSLGGYDKANSDIHKWSCTGSSIDSCKWELLDRKLPHGDWQPLAIQIPDDTLANQMCNN